MSSTNATYCSFAGLLEIRKMESAPKAYSMLHYTLAEFATSPAGELISEIISPEQRQSEAPNGKLLQARAADP
jgi:hypothetical protein